MAARSRHRPHRSDAETSLNFADAFYDLKADFRAGTDSRFHSRLRGVSAAGSGADYHYRDERKFLHMIERAREYRRNDQVVGQGIRRLVTNVVQDGFNLDPQTGDKGLNAELKARWWEWAEDPDQCHAEQELDWNQIECLTLDSMIVDGDLLHLPLREGSLQPIEAHRLRTPSRTTRNVVHGILLDARARRREYWVTKEDLDLFSAVRLVSDVKPYPARDRDGFRQVFHCYDPYRFSQRRGVTALAPISFTVGSFDDTQFAAQVKQQMGCLVALLRERTGDWNPDLIDGDEADGAGPRTTETEGGYTRTIEGMSAGLEIGGAKGEKLSMFSADVPGPQFREHSLLILTFIAINLDLPLAVLLLDPSETNFSGWRGAIDQARLRWRQIQARLVKVLHRPTYRWKLRQWMSRDPALRAAADRLKNRFWQHQWHPPRWPYIEPHKDAAADELQDQKLLTSKRRLQNRKGDDWDDVSTEIIEDNVQIIRKAIEAKRELLTEYPDESIDWREIMRLPTADTVTAALAQDPPAKPDKPPRREPNASPG